ncbi:hypothetical protein, variant [Aphanomyces invadans]|uniref:SRR1-like domain-containing protein n=1 Tax=Aphanomyces invadans TaxID=157072 RepID=A0A024UNK2_9STRA|nr:hypothetical protein, variant [Aphanomyces invadans]ETW07392.1 hypothetical protein, variant [Aphanomyces invadans]|eukprot:XP_008863485.1 hypothetical protein, variant [Aphanomyces invadans]
MSDEIWTFVGRKGKSARKPVVKHQAPSNDAPPFAYKHKASAPSVPDKDASAILLGKVRRHVDVMRRSPFLGHLFDALDGHIASRKVEDTPLVIQLVCYGLGSFTSSNAAYQLACAVHIREWLAGHAAIHLQHACLFDPIMTQDDAVVASAMDFDVLTTNEQGHRRATKSLQTLFFMPHCGKQLYQNVLLANWESLQYVFILGNSFSAYDDRVVAAADRHKSIFSALVPYVDEVAVGKIAKSWDEYVQYDAAFNDMSLHAFPATKVEAAIRDGVLARPTGSFDVGTDEDLM